MSERSTYLGDGLYVELDDFGMVVLYTSDGVRHTNTVYLEPKVLENFVNWIKERQEAGR